MAPDPQLDPAGWRIQPIATYRPGHHPIRVMIWVPDPEGGQWCDGIFLEARNDLLWFDVAVWDRQPVVATHWCPMPPPPPAG